MSELEKLKDWSIHGVHITKDGKRIDPKDFYTDGREMSKCKMCGSYAINQHLHGRKKGVDIDLCDVCYWRIRAENRRDGK